MEDDEDDDLTVEEKYAQLLKKLETDDKDKLTDKEEYIQLFAILIAVFINLIFAKFICEYYNLYYYSEHMQAIIWHILVWIEVILVRIFLSKKWWIVSFDKPKIKK